MGEFFEEKLIVQARDRVIEKVETLAVNKAELINVFRMIMISLQVWMRLPSWICISKSFLRKTYGVLMTWHYNMQRNVLMDHYLLWESVFIGKMFLELMLL